MMEPVCCEGDSAQWCVGRGLGSNIDTTCGLTDCCGDVSLVSLVEVDRRFRRAYCPHGRGTHRFGCHQEGLSDWLSA
jgi:hypothetical protein